MLKKSVLGDLAVGLAISYFLPASGKTPFF